MPFCADVNCGKELIILPSGRVAELGVGENQARRYACRFVIDRGRLESADCHHLPGEPQPRYVADARVP